MSQWSWTYALIELNKIDTALPAAITRFDYSETDEDGNVTDVHPTYRQATRSRQVGLGAKNDTHQIVKFSQLDFETEIPALQAEGFTLMPQGKAAELVASWSDEGG
tara:strand:- start:3188 stop:3505 length:318 start_codon:yes stop_codon:yes gene_type:complete